MSFLTLILIAFSEVFGISAFGQSLIVGIPSSDTSPHKKLNLAFELQSKANENFGRQFSGFVFSTYGVMDSLELGASLLNLSNARVDANEALVFGYKKNWILKQTDGLKIVSAVGQMIGPNFRDGPLAHWHYALVSQELSSLGLRLTQGLCYANRSVYGQDSASVMLGIEHRWSSKWMGVIDWYSGSHDFAAAIYAIQYRPTHSFLAFLGWKQRNVGNIGAVMTEMSYEF